VLHSLVSLCVALSLRQKRPHQGERNLRVTAQHRSNADTLSASRVTQGATSLNSSCIVHTEAVTNMGGAVRFRGEGEMAEGRERTLSEVVRHAMQIMPT
jgi:hypothetical protein